MGYTDRSKAFVVANATGMPLSQEGLIHVASDQKWLKESLALTSNWFIKNMGESGCKLWIAQESQFLDFNFCFRSCLVHTTKLLIIIKFVDRVENGLSPIAISIVG